MTPKPDGNKCDEIKEGQSQDFQPNVVNQSIVLNADEEISYEELGYSQIPQGPDGLLADENEEDDDELSVDSLLTAAGIDTEHESSFASEEIKERKELWKTARERNEASALDDDAADKIKTLMSGFTLPPNHIPDWASQIPEDRWISELLSKITNQN